MKTFYASCVAVLLVLVVITMALRSESTTFYGIADAQELVINDEFPVEIARMMVVPGQKVRAGDTLAQVKRPELDFKIAEINRQLNELRTQKSAHVNLSRSEVLQFKAQQDAKAGELRAQIRELEVQLETNQKLIAELKSLKKNESATDGTSDLTNPVTIKIQQLKNELATLLDSSQTGMGRLNNELSYAGEPLAEKVRGLQKELDVLLEEKSHSCKIAQISGVIGEVNFKEGEKLSPFTSLVTLHAESPSYVRGYIHENTYSQVQEGQRVSVSSLADKSNMVAGEVVGVGSRIVEYPVRLRKNPEMQMWGREVTIKIPEANHFLLGEKVLISLLDYKKAASFLELPLSIFGQKVYAADSTFERIKNQGSFALPGIITQECRFGGAAAEASGVIYLGDIKKYAVISDDTPGNKPLVYLVDSACGVEKVLSIEGLDRIDDMEGITQDERGTIYIMASQSANKKGLLPAARKVFARVKRTGERLQAGGTVLFSDWLAAEAAREPGTEWAKYVSAAMSKHTCDIEAVAVKRGALYIGFKSPLAGGRSVVLAIEPVSHIFDGGAARVRIWQSFDLKDRETGIVGTIADMQFVGGDLFILANAEPPMTDRAHACGLMWRSAPDGKKHSVVWRSAGGNPEGFAYNADKHLFLITYDSGRNHSL
jgi:multidrug resistance efflux pump